MSSEQGACVTPMRAAELQPDSTRHLPSPPSSSSSTSDAVPDTDAVSDTSLQPPPLPYVPDACFDIKPHKPPPPYDGGSDYNRPDPKEWNGNPWPWGEGSPDTVIEQYLAVPPRMTTPPPDQTARRLQIIHQIRCGDPCNAQVVRCCVDGRELVAKIFDPLYVGLDNECGRPPTYFSERFYSCEAAAYERIKEHGLDGRFTPRFEGCWYLELPLRKPDGIFVRREVRLILQQHIPGDTMQNLGERGEVDKIDPKVRMDLLDRLMETISQLDFIGVQSLDVHPRNIMLFKDAKNEWQITLVDFSHSRVQGLPNSKRRIRREELQLPESPLTILWDCWPNHCEGWVPKEYDCKTKDSFERRLKWMKNRWEGSNQYGPVNYRFLPRFIADDPTDDESAEDDPAEDDT